VGVGGRGGKADGGGRDKRAKLGGGVEEKGGKKGNRGGGEGKGTGKVSMGGTEKEGGGVCGRGVEGGEENMWEEKKR